VKVGLMFGLDLTSPQQDGKRLFAFALELAEEAEHLGCDALWFSEHHLWENGHLTQPLVYCAAVAARTKRIRVGTAITIPAFTSAVQVAEEATVVDLLSGGRLDLGLGAGYQIAEFELFGLDVNRRYGLLDRRVTEIRNLWDEGRLTPSPVQDPIPIWLGYHGPMGARRAGLLGEGLLTADARSWEPYRTGLIAGGHDPAIGRMSGDIAAWISDDPDRDWPAVRPMVADKFDRYRLVYAEGRGMATPNPVDPDRLRDADMQLRTLSYFLHATPEEAAQKIKGFVAGAPVEEVHLNFPVSGLSEELVVQEVQTICNRLAPLLRSTRPAGDEPET
jgi:alkanesulfonate monooxygenase SsuD/methylene tetrahydromethanopterin reductase-like flavin-dependent oxidoreductase (luciferase family)